MRQVALENGVKAWAFSSSQCVQASVKNVEEHPSKKDMKLPARASAPLSNGCRPETDASPELNAIESSYCQSLIGVLHWMAEIG